MKANLPENKFFDSFYIWFNKDKKQEYYATPMYFYQNDTKINNDERIAEIFYNKKAKVEKSEEGLKFPGNTYFPYIEKFGMFLLRFLNANLETFETAYETFFFAYGFELLKELDEEYTFELKGKYKDNAEYISKVTKIYSDLQYQIQEIQQELIFAVNYIYNIEEKEELKEYTPSQRFAVYLIKRKGELYTYNKNDNIIRDSYSNKYLEFMGDSEEKLLNSLKDNSMFVSMIDTH